MRIIKGLVVFSFLCIVLGSCFDRPEFPDTPYIEFEKIEFVPSPTGNDSLVIYFHFQDGNGDLGLSSNNPRHIEPPYQSRLYFLETGDGELEAVSMVKRSNNLPPFIELKPGQTGKIATLRTKGKPGYEYLPDFNSDCEVYKLPTTDSLLISPGNSFIIDDSYYKIDTLTSSTPGNIPETVYILKDTLYFEKNPNHHNIEINFFFKTSPTAEPEEYDWEKELCRTFDARFPELENTERPLEGTIRYAMASFGLLKLFGNYHLNLKIQIKDRALNRSNIIETGDFTLAGIRRN